MSTLPIHRLYLTLRDAIVEGAYTPGELISEPRLATAHGASRSYVRQAVMMLARERFLERVPGRGLVIAPASLQMLECVFEMRAEIEAWSAAKAAETATPRQIAEITCHLRGRGAFHLAIGSAARNNQMAALLAWCICHVTRISTAGGVPERCVRSRPTHEDILTAIELRRPALARSLMHRHLAEARDRILREFAHRPS